MSYATLTVEQQSSKHLVGSLGETDSSFRLLVASVLDYAIVMLDPTGKVVSWNAGAEHLKGYKAEEIIGQNFSRFYPQKDVEAGKPSKELEIAAREGRFEDLGQRIRKDGTLFWASVVITALRNETGELLGFGKVTRDLTERQHAEAALREGEETLRLLIESFKDTAIFMLDVHGRVLSWNVGAERIKGYKANEIIGQHFSIFYSNEDRANKKPERELEIASKTGRFEDEGWRVKKDGSHFRASVIIFAIRDASGKLKGYSKLTQDLTERGHLQKLEEVQRATFNILEDFADEREKIREIQHATFNILEDFSSEKERLEDTQHATFNILDDFVKEQEKLEQLQKAAFNILEDLSSEKEKLKSEVDERKRAEIALESVNKELEAFSYSVSHDLRAPLRGLDGFSQALLEDYKDKLDDKGKEYLGYVRSSSQQMAQLIDDLLNLSRMTRSELHRELVNLSELVHGLVELLRKTNPERHAEFRIADSLTAFVDRRLIKIALENLLNNAWKFTNKCAKTIIEFGSLEYEGGKAFFIRDNGAGFDMSYASKLFGAFQRLHAAAEYPGTGIGLATVRRIINRHGGKVWAEGNVGQGATFYFTLS